MFINNETILYLDDVQFITIVLYITHLGDVQYPGSTVLCITGGAIFKHSLLMQTFKDHENFVSISGKGGY